MTVIKLFFNYLSHALTKSEKSLLCKSLNFAILPKTLEYADYLIPVELLYGNIHNLDTVMLQITSTAFIKFSRKKGGVYLKNSISAKNFVFLRD